MAGIVLLTYLIWERRDMPSANACIFPWMITFGALRMVIEPIILYSQYISVMLIISEFKLKKAMRAATSFLLPITLWVGFERYWFHILIIERRRCRYVRRWNIVISCVSTFSRLSKSSFVTHIKNFPLILLDFISSFMPLRRGLMKHYINAPMTPLAYNAIASDATRRDA